MKNQPYRSCPDCGANLDPGEICDCQKGRGTATTEPSSEDGVTVIDPMKSTEIIVVKQLPVIEEQLRTVKMNIQRRVADVLGMECTEDTYKAVKRARAELNAEYRDLETRRKEVKAKIEAPYKAFEAVYKDCAADIYAKADRVLAEKIGAVENGLKQSKANALLEYFNEYRQSLNLPEDLADFRFAGINVTLTASEKSLKAQAKTFLDRLCDDLSLIQRYPECDEIIHEYRQCRNVAKAVQIVYDRHAQIDAERRRREEEQEAFRKAQEHIAAVESAIEEEQFAAPEAVEDPAEKFHEPVPKAIPEENVPGEARVEPQVPVYPQIYSVSFRVSGTLEQLKAMKKFLIDGGYTYEQLN